MELTALAERLNATVFTPEGLISNNPIIKGVLPLETATSEHISFLTQPRAFNNAQNSDAAAILCFTPREDLKKMQLIHKNPYAAMAHTQQWLTEDPVEAQGIADLAFIHPDAQLAPSVSVQPLCTVRENTKISAHTYISSHVYIGRSCVIGEHCHIGPHVSIMDGTIIGNNVIIHPNAVIGSDGFGFAKDETGLIKIPQNGHVVIEDNVEIGASCTIDRATFHETRIGFGTKLDSQVHIAHNVHIGPHSVLCGQTGVAGSTEIGAHFTAAGQSAIGQGIKITDNVTLGPRSGATKSITESGDYMGMPCVPSKNWMKQAVGTQKLPELLKRVQRLEQKIDQLGESHE